MIPLNMNETKVVEIGGTNYTIGRMPGHKMLACTMAISRMVETGDSSGLVSFIKAGLREFSGDVDALPADVIFQLYLAIRDFNSTSEEAAKN